MKLFRAYREQAARLSDLNELLAGEGRATALSGARLPVDEVREIFERRAAPFSRASRRRPRHSQPNSTPATICSPR